MSETSERKDDHIRLVRKGNVEVGETGFRDVDLVHEALPEIHLDEVDTSLDFFGKKLNAPIFIDSMTGGSEKGKKINKNLAAAAEKCNIAMGVGSQRAAIEDKDLVDTFSVVRDVAPNAFIYGNLGAAQLNEYGVEGVIKAVEMIDADGMAIHLNFLQECVQPEGDIDANDCLKDIEKISSELDIPIIVKETGCGISKSTAKKLNDLGVEVVNVAGSGGSSWVVIESERALAAGAEEKASLGKLFKEWGIPTAISTIEVSEVHPCVISSGGVRSGLDVAKGIALGAEACGLAKPFLEPGLQSKEQTVDKIKKLKSELKTAMFATGSRNLEKLREGKVIITGKSREYLESLRRE